MSIEAEWPRAAGDRSNAPATPAERARLILQLFLDQRIDLLRSLLHPDAQLETGFATPGARFDQHGVLDAAWVAINSGAYRPEYELVESLDDSTALVGVSIRYEIGEDLFSERDAAILMSFRDGLLWRSRFFDTIDDARRAQRLRVRLDRQRRIRRAVCGGQPRSRRSTARWRSTSRTLASSTASPSS